MTLLLVNNRLTPGDPMVTALSRRTHEGMAHFAGTGPEDRTCRECEHWMSRGKWSREGDLGMGGEPLDSPCAKARQFMMKRRTASVPHDACACKWFVLSERPQPLKRPEKD
jgi:hypothetical protein